MGRDTKVKVCPCCKRPLPPRIELGGFRQRRLVDFVAANPSGVTKEQIIDAMYGDDPNGGPTAAAATVRTTVYLVNKKLEKHGLRITARPGGMFAHYKLLAL